MKEFDYSDDNIKRTIQADYFKRNNYIQNLIKYINNADEQTTYAINGGWGSGKTVFMHQFMYAVRNREIFNGVATDETGTKDIEVFYYNAWERELLKQPSIGILEYILDEYHLFSQEERRIAIEAVKKVGNTLLKLSTAGGLSIDDFTAADKVEVNIKNIRESFAKVIDNIKKDKKCKKVVIIIDELDRCKPTTVINMLEEIKHFYEHDSLCFIFSADFKQLGYTIKKMYGENFDSDLYLQRFFDTTFMLNSSDYEKYISEELLYDIRDTYIAHEICKVAIAYNTLSIRETNKFIKKIKVIKDEIFSFNMYNPELVVVKAIFVPWAIALKYKNSEKYQALIYGDLEEQEIRAFMDTSKDLAKWLKDCCYGWRDDEELCIYTKVYEAYKKYFRKAEFRYWGEEYQDTSMRRKVLSYIEF